MPTQHIVKEESMTKGWHSGYAMDFKTPYRCPLCTYPLILDWILEDTFPYTHCDFQMACHKCGWKGVFGLATNPLFGMELIIWDSQPELILQEASELEPPTCPFHLKPMTLTKIWGDKVLEDPSQMRVQWKCPDLYLTIHRTVTRKQAGNKDAYTPAESKRILEKLKELGYVD